jgi:hypothetical protein
MSVWAGSAVPRQLDVQGMEGGGWNFPTQKQLLVREWESSCKSQICLEGLSCQTPGFIRKAISIENYVHAVLSEAYPYASPSSVGYPLSWRK